MKPIILFFNLFYSQPLEIRKASLENVLKLKHLGNGNEKETEKSLSVCRCDLCLFEDSPESYLDSTFHHTELEPGSRHKLKVHEKRSKLIKKFRRMGNEENRIISSKIVRQNDYKDRDDNDDDDVRLSRSKV